MPLVRDLQESPLARQRSGRLEGPDVFAGSVLRRSMPGWTDALSPARIVLMVPGDHAGRVVRELGGRHRHVEAARVTEELCLLAKQAKARVQLLALSDGHPDVALHVEHEHGC